MNLLASTFSPHGPLSSTDDTRHENNQRKLQKVKVGRIKLEYNNNLLVRPPAALNLLQAVEDDLDDVNFSLKVLLEAEMLAHPGDMKITLAWLLPNVPALPSSSTEKSSLLHLSFRLLLPN